ncbi:NIPSNAP family containing protein [Flavobacteriaceae bacterium R33]|uniref:NIPSNAP family containing protein n=2 Tax=Poritiphilus flavus TaxID=2697053 RepID=A0A6L9EG99_9FLAO|nr:NIPSNAP family containing protein [Poritiphilus flavus]
MIKKILLTFALILAFQAHANDEVYELRVYKLQFGKSAQVLHDYFQKALLPALNRQGITNIGAFEESSDNMPKKLYLLISYKDMQAYSETLKALKKDKTYIADAKAYSGTSQEDFPIDRYESSLFLSVSGFPKLVKPKSGSRLFELRTYEGYSEDAVRRKIKMFNDSEFTIFDEIGLYTVFFGEKIAGQDMPSLAYLLAFEDMEERDANWKKFGPHPEWQRIVKLEEYANTVSSIDRVYLKPLPYSQL